jgi:soluble lytic murein transglycosylase-like protein
VNKQDKQIKIGQLFNFFVRIVGASRYTKRQIPVLALMSITAVGVSVSNQATRALVVNTASEVRMAASFAAEEAGAVGLAESLAPEASARKTELKLNREQLNVVKFIASRYDVDINDAKTYVDFAYKAAKSQKVDPLLVLAVMSIESSFDPDAQSHAGAQGLMQVLTRVHKEKFVPFGGTAAAYDPESNIKVGVQILKQYLVRNGSEAEALKSYVGAALMDSDGGYGYKVLSQKARIVAASLGQPVPANPVVNLPIMKVAVKTVLPASDAQGLAEPPVEEIKAVDIVAVEKSTDI